MKNIILFILLPLFSTAQPLIPTTYGGEYQIKKMETVAPTLWKYADGMDTSDSYCLHKGVVIKDSVKTTQLFLIGFNKEGEENMRLSIEEGWYVPLLGMCFVYQNGMEIRLREKIF